MVEDKIIMKSVVGFGSLLLIAVFINVAQCRQFQRSSLLDEESIDRGGLPSYESLMKSLLGKCQAGEEINPASWECQLFRRASDDELINPSTL
eukprot:TCALIF_05816-PA protein Name:"Protein of unknown function" AED:0.02 eAED:0.02 QI:0/0/0.5/0.5/1/1/2/332/92